MKKITFAALLLLSFFGFSQSGSELWLSYTKIENSDHRTQLAAAINAIVLASDSERSQLAAQELQQALESLLDKKIPILQQAQPIPGSIFLNIKSNDTALGKDGFIILRKEGKQRIEASNDLGLLYGAFAFARELQEIGAAPFEKREIPKVRYRMLNHWDNANGTVERGYAGASLWKWFELPYRLDPRYEQYARANAAIGINAVSLNNVNASSRFLTAEYLEKIKALADLFRPYGIQVFISVNFRSPRTLGGLTTSDPLDPDVRQWWKEKTAEIHRYIPDFGGFLVKANSEGEPGPQDYGRTHAEGANMLAAALENYPGIVIWRAFVYKADPNGDRFKEAYEQFKPLDGQFDEKVIVQVKNGPIDFMPREPFHPMFGAFKKTALAVEFQITQEYLGHSTHWVYLAPMFKECLDADTYATGKGATVGKVIDGSVYPTPISLMAGVANTGSDANFTGHPMAQSNWYAFGRLAWDHTLSAVQLAKEWTAISLSQKKEVIQKISTLMLNSHATYVNYTYPLGLHHMMGEGHHFGPQPWLDKSQRPDWTSTYYHRAAASGIGFDRTGKMSNALSLYAPEVQNTWKDPQQCDLNYLLWFHHLPWDYPLSTGRMLWEELMHRYYQGVEEVEQMRLAWAQLEEEIEEETFNNVATRLQIQKREALWWRDSGYLYFKTFSNMPLPEGLTPPTRSLEEVKALEKIYHLR